MQKTYNVYYNLGYWFILLIVLAFAGFYTSYLSVIFRPTLPVIHIHFTLMAIWMVMLVAQPFLIKYKKLAIHRLLGKVSYVLVPLVLLSAFLMMRMGYYRDLGFFQQQAASGVNNLTNDQILHKVRGFAALPFVWFFWFIIFYSMAIINRRKSAVHARYMLATGLSLFGPIIDRIFFRVETVANNIPAESVAFFLADLILGLLLWKDYQEKRSTRTLRNCLVIYLIGQLLYFTAPGSLVWQSFVAFVMRPAP